MAEALAESRGYHHGDLRNALILAAAELIEESGSLDFAMAEAARRAGVSVAAPYRHFKDRDELLQDVARLCFMGLTEANRQALAGMDVATEEAIVAMGTSYIRFMQEHRNFHDLMWGESGARAMDNANMEMRSSGFHILVDCIAALCEREGIAPVDPVELATEMWATVHGLSSLAMSGQIDRFLPEADAFKLLEHSTRIFFDGLRRG